MALVGDIGRRVSVAGQSLRRPVPSGSHHLTRGYHHITSYSTALVQSSRQLSRPARKQLSTPTRYSGLGTRRTFIISTDFSGAIETTQRLYSAFHATTGLPWYLTIPLIALSFNLVTRLPITIYNQDVHRRRPELTTILRAWKDTHAKVIQKNYPDLSPVQKDKLLKSEFDETSARLFRLYGVEKWKDYLNFSILPIWLFNIETMRRMSGAPQGLLGTLIHGRDKTSTITPAIAPSKPDLASLPESGHAMAPEQMLNATQQDMTAFEQSVTTVASTGDPSLATGGCLWFPDLMVADPYHILPGVLSVLLVLNILPSSREGLLTLVGANSSKVTSGNRGRVALMRFLLLLSISAGPLTAQLPAAIHLYWISTVAITTGMKKMAERRWPIPKIPVIEPCKGGAHIVQMPKREKSTGQ